MGAVSHRDSVTNVTERKCRITAMSHRGSIMWMQCHTEVVSHETVSHEAVSHGGNVTQRQYSMEAMSHRGSAT